MCVEVPVSVHDLSRTDVFSFMRTLLIDMAYPCIWHGSRTQQKQAISHPLGAHVLKMVAVRGVMLVFKN